MTKQYDAIIIGAGQAGWPLAGHLPGEGWKTALIEAKALGGTCVNVGCTPTKTLVASAHAIHTARRGAEFGFSSGPITVDMARIKARADERIHSSRSGLEGWLHNLDNLDVIYGYGAFEDAHTVTVNGDRLQAEHIIINTGTRPGVPPIPGLADVDYMTNAEILQLDTVPDHLIVIGGSYIGLEFAQVFRRFGSTVTVIEMMPRLIMREDEDISEAVKDIMTSEGITVLTGTKTTAVSQNGNQYTVTVDDGSGSRTISGSHLLVATGRLPNSNQLGLDRAGVTTTERGYIPVTDRMETNVSGIWATGDVTGRGAFTHTSYNDYEILADILVGSDTRRLTDRVMTYGLFTDPPLGRVGMTEREALDAGHDVLIGKRPMAHIGRAIDKAETHGFMKFVIDARTDRFLGAAILGVGGDEIIASITNLMYADAPYTVFKNAVHVHPTVAELIPTTLADLKPAGTTD